MQTFDAVVAAVAVGAAAGTLGFRTARAWHRFRVQERAADLMEEAVRYLEEGARPQAQSKANEKR